MRFFLKSHHRWQATIAVIMYPGLTVLTVTPFDATS
jgi:hypothetical protein